MGAVCDGSSAHGICFVYLNFDPCDCCSIQKEKERIREYEYCIND